MKSAFFLAVRTPHDSLQEVDSQEERQNRVWVILWRETAAALEEVKARELRALTEEEAGRMFADMAADTADLWISPERANSAGFIEQQRLFLRSHEHPARHRSRA